MKRKKKRLYQNKIEEKAKRLLNEYYYIKSCVEKNIELNDLYGNSIPYKLSDEELKIKEKEAMELAEIYIKEMKFKYSILYYIVPEDKIPEKLITSICNTKRLKNIHRKCDFIETRHDEIITMERIKKRLSYQKKMLKYKMICEYGNYYMIEKIIPKTDNYIDDEFKKIFNQLNNEIKIAKKSKEKHKKELEEVYGDDRKINT